MITPKILEEKISAALPGAIVQVSSDDNVHFYASVKASQFKGLTRVAQQQKVYAALGNMLSTGEVHALSLQTAILE